jgi:hypothetical protein
MQELRNKTSSLSQGQAETEGTHNNDQLPKCEHVRLHDQWCW